MGSEDFDKEQEQKDIQAWLDALDAMIYAFESIIKAYYVPKEHVHAYERELNSIWRTYKKKVIASVHSIALRWMRFMLNGHRTLNSKKQWCKKA